MAYFSKAFLFSHLPKAGGGSLQSAFDAAGSDLDGKVISHHNTALEFLTSLKKYHFFLVRNPWDYYVSQYEYGRSQKEHGYVWEANNFSFDDFCKFLCSFPIEGFRDLDSVGYQSKYFFNFSYTFEEIERLDIENPPPSIVKVYRLEDGLESVVGDLNSKFNLSLQLPSKRFNSSPRRPYREYYSESTRQLIADTERVLIKRFNYSF